LKPDKNQRNSFHIAAERRSCNSLRLLVDCLGEVPMKPDSQGNSPLHYSVRHGE